MEIDYVAIGKRIAKIRKSQGLTQVRLAELANIDGKYMSCIERGKNAVSTKTYTSISYALKVPLDYIINGKDTLLPMDTLDRKIHLLDERQRKVVEYLVDGFIGGKIEG